MDNTKIINISETPIRAPNPLKTHLDNKRAITQSRGWTFTDTDYRNENQMNYLRTLTNENEQTPQQKFILQQLYNKLSGYRSQDKIKKIYNESAFIQIDTVIRLLIESGLHCFYCKSDIKVLYEIVRETDQWTLDRIDNSMGHNTDNVFVACLLCNLRRKTMYHERYVFTKSCTNVVKLDETQSKEDCA
jgi:hypothetical protein